jgi:hypothetical protein
MRTIAPAAPAKEASPSTLRTPGGIVTACANNGNAPGATETILGNNGRTSGVAASTNINISLFSAANANNGSNLLRDKPASCAFESKPDCATFVSKPDDSTSVKMFLTATLFPIESTSSRMVDAYSATGRCC